MMSGSSSGGWTPDDFSQPPDLSLVAPRLWVGAAIDSLDERTARGQVREIVQLGVDVVVDCRLGADDSELWDHAEDVEYHRHGIEDAGQPVSHDWFTHGVELVMDRWHVRRRGVYVHCEEGVNRAPSLVFAVLLVSGLTPRQAVHRIVDARPVAGLRYGDAALRWFEMFSDVHYPEFNGFPGGRR